MHYNFNSGNAPRTTAWLSWSTWWCWLISSWPMTSMSSLGHHLTVFAQSYLAHCTAASLIRSSSRDLSFFFIPHRNRGPPGRAEPQEHLFLTSLGTWWHICGQTVIVSSQSEIEQVGVRASTALGVHHANLLFSRPKPRKKNIYTRAQLGVPLQALGFHFWN